MPEKGRSIADMREYYDALDYVLRNQDIHNVALSGSYGSGKSSVLGSYENRHHEKKFIHVTLARFDEPYHDSKNMDIIQTNYPNQMTVFILSDADEFLKLASDNSITLEEGELSELFFTKQLSVQQEERLLDLIDGTAARSREKLSYRNSGQNSFRPF